jgi:heme-degrading monooxygenase HmoA
MISRIWHGWTTHQDADKYEALLKEEIFEGILKRGIPGFKAIQLLRRVVEKETEFITIMTFDSIESVKKFAGKDHEQAVVPEEARAMLSRFDQRSQHYEIKEERRAK